VNRGQRRVLSGALLIIGGAYIARTILVAYFEITDTKLGAFHNVGWLGAVSVLGDEVKWLLGAALAAITAGLYVGVGGERKPSNLD
jgi:hypothetical protein